MRPFASGGSGEGRAADRKDVMRPPDDVIGAGCERGFAEREIGCYTRRRPIRRDELRAENAGRAPKGSGFRNEEFAESAVLCWDAIMMMNLRARMLDTMKGRGRYTADQKKNRGRDPEGSRRYVANDGLHECDSESVAESMVPQGPSQVRGTPSSLTSQIYIRDRVMPSL